MPPSSPSSPTSHVPLLALRGIHKSYGDLVVNDGVDLDVLPGEVHAVLGENGAGKTTLMRIAYGLSVADAGRIEVEGAPISVRSPRDAMAAGIGMVTQHFALVGPMTVAENVVLSTAGIGPLDLEAARSRVSELAAELGSPIDPDAVVDSLSVGQQQRVEILKALHQGARVLILDEPTAVLVPQETAALFDSLRRLTAGGLGVLFISHKLHEVAAISQRVSVLRQGRIVTTIPTASATPAELAELMVGRAVGGVAREVLRPDEPASGVPHVHRVDLDAAQDVSQSALLSLRAVCLEPAAGKRSLDEVSLDVYPGEILAVAGVSGNGQRELADVLSGMAIPTSGQVLLAGQDVTGSTPRGVIESGLGRIPEDRHGSVVEDLSVADNLVLEDLAQFRRGPFLDRRAIRRHAEDLIERFSIKARPDDRIGGLSGGNMQKVLLARVLARDPRVLIVAQPTRGLDVGAGEYVHRQLLARREAGAAILLISEDLDEIMALADRIAVMYEGRIMGVVPAADATRAGLGLLMAGRASSSSGADTGTAEGAA